MNPSVEPVSPASAAIKKPHPLKQAAREVLRRLMPSRFSPEKILAEQTAAAINNAESPEALGKFLTFFFDQMMENPDDICPQVSAPFLKSIFKILEISYASYSTPPREVVVICDLCCQILIASAEKRRDLITDDMFKDAIELYEATSHKWGSNRLQEVLGAMSQYTLDFDNVPPKLAGIFERNALDTTNDMPSRITGLDGLLVLGLNCTPMITDSIRMSLDKISINDKDSTVKKAAERNVLAIEDAVKYPNDLHIRRLTTGLYLKSIAFESCYE